MADTQYAKDDDLSAYQDTGEACTYLERIRLNQGGYDAFGSYWGHGAPLWRWMAVDAEGNNPCGHIRARDRDTAKAIIRQHQPKARFWR